MGFRVPKSSFVIGNENEDGSLTFYANKTDPERFSTLAEAEAKRNYLNYQDSGLTWEIYRMNFEIVRLVEAKAKT